MPSRTVVILSLMLVWIVGFVRHFQVFNGERDNALVLQYLNLCFILKKVVLAFTYLHAMQTSVSYVPINRSCRLVL